MSDAPKTVLVTGASSGIGLQTALYFFERKWNVIATMRNPEKRTTLLHEKGLPDLVHMDMTDTGSIHTAVQYGLDKYQGIDVLVNNAGYAVFGPFEATTPAQVAREFNTNLFGLMQLTRELLPVFRQQRDGILINVASMSGRTGFPLYSIYNGSKWAVEGFSEALRYELKPLNIRVKIIEPGVVPTDFYERSQDTVDCTDYMEAYGKVLKRDEKRYALITRYFRSSSRAVAKTIYRAATDGNWRLRYPVGNESRLVLFFRWLMPPSIFYWMLEKVFIG